MTLSYMMKIFSAVVCLLLLHSAGSVPLRPSSTEKSSLHKRSASGSIVEFRMNQDSRSALSSQNDSLEQFAKYSEQAFNGLTCPDYISEGADVPVFKRSSCPWYYIHTHEPKRFPAAILQAASLCEYAIDSGDNLPCEPVSHTITVLKQQSHKDADGNFIWLEETQEVVIGYTASGKRIAPSQTTTQAFVDPDFYDK